MLLNRKYLCYVYLLTELQTMQQRFKDRRVPLKNQNTVIRNKIKNINSYLNPHKTIPVITISKNKIPDLKT